MPITSRLATLLGLTVALGLTVIAVVVATDRPGSPAEPPRAPVAVPSPEDIPVPAAPPRGASFRDVAFGRDAGLREGPTADKAQSKLWLAHDTWWGVLLDAESGEFRIHRLGWDDQTWDDTGVTVDERPQSQADVLAAGDLLYVVSAGSDPYRGDAARLLRYRWDAATGAYRLDDGFPVEITDRGVTTIVVARDTTERLWVTYIEGGRLLVNRSLDADAHWGTPFTVPGILDPSASRATVIAAGGEIHVLWTSGSEDAVLQAIHPDGEPDDRWQTKRALVEGVQNADDHLNVKAIEIDGEVRLYAAIKTSFDTVARPNPHAAQVVLIEILPDGAVRTHLAGRVRDRHTRPIVLLDEDRREIYVVATSPFGGGEIYYKRSSLDAISFTPGKGTALVHSRLDPTINDVTSTKQNLTARSGLVVLASDVDTGMYLHGVLNLGGPRWDAPSRTGPDEADGSPAPEGDPPPEPAVSLEPAGG